MPPPKGALSHSCYITTYRTCNDESRYPITYYSATVLIIDRELYRITAPTIVVEDISVEEPPADGFPAARETACTGESKVGYAVGGCRVWDLVLLKEVVAVGFDCTAEGEANKSEACQRVGTGSIGSIMSRGKEGEDVEIEVERKAVERHFCCGE